MFSTTNSGPRPASVYKIFSVNLFAINNYFLTVFRLQVRLVLFIRWNFPTFRINVYLFCILKVAQFLLLQVSHCPSPILVLNVVLGTEEIAVFHLQSSFTEIFSIQAYFSYLLVNGMLSFTRLRYFSRLVPISFKNALQFCYLSFIEISFIQTNVLKLHLTLEKTKYVKMTQRNI